MLLSAATIALAMTAGGDLTGLGPDLDRIARETDGTLGAAVRLVETGETVVLNGDGRFPMQSVYKAPIGMAVLHEVDAGRLSLDAPIRVEATDLVPSGMHSPLRDAHPKGGVDVPLRELLRLSVEESDGTASDVLNNAVSMRRRASRSALPFGRRARSSMAANADGIMTWGKRSMRWARRQSRSKG